VGSYEGARNLDNSAGECKDFMCSEVWFAGFASGDACDDADSLLLHFKNAQSVRGCPPKEKAVREVGVEVGMVN
jgi:hypothetical protein